jgi:hypothetical protein
MINQQQTTKQFIGGQFASAQNERAVSGEVLNLKRRVDFRNEDLASELEVERRDVTTVVVLGYN